MTKEQIDSIIEGRETYKRHPVEIERIKKGIVPYKYSFLERWINEFFEFVTPYRPKPGYVGRGYRFEMRSLRHNLAILFTYGILLPFFLIGIVLTIKQRNMKGMIILALILIHTFIHVFVLWVRARYRVPIDIFIIILSSYGFLWVYDRLKKRRLIANSLNT